MPGTVTSIASSYEQEQRVLSILSILQRLFLILLTVLALPILLGWVIPPLGRHLPAGWSQMKANTALLVALSTLSIFLTQSRRPRRAILTGIFLGICVFALSTLIAIEFAGVVLLPIDTLLAPDAAAIVPGRPSLQACIGFMLMGLVLAALRARRGALSRVVDFGTFLLCLFFFSFLGSLLLVEGTSMGRSLRLQLAPQSFVCIGLLVLLVVVRRTEYGIFSVLIDTGIGGTIARIASPVAIFLPFAIELMRAVIIRHQLLPYNYALAIAPSLMAVLIFCLILVLARRSGDLERATRDLSLRDELTRVYNRRGVLAFGQKSRSHAIRAREAFSVLFVDVDGLKSTNDRFGHDVGSELLADVARILQATFREVDVVGRLGGDEFVVAARADEPRMEIAIKRLQEAVEAENARQVHPYTIGFSLGCVTTTDPADTLEDLIEQADERMYEAKRTKRSL